MTKRKWGDRRAAGKPSPTGKGRPSAGARPGEEPRRPARGGPRPGLDEPTWLWGGHAVLAAVANPRRRCHRLLLGKGEAAETWKPRLADLLSTRRDLRQGIEELDRPAFSRFLPPQAVHQGIAVLVSPLEHPDLDQVLDTLEPDAPAGILLLDHVSDPQNVGAILRSAAAFRAAAVVTTRRHAPPESGALAKAASGALEHLPFPRVANLARAIEKLQTRDFQSVGLAAGAPERLHVLGPMPRVALVLGGEGSGLRRLTRERVDRLVSLPTSGPVAQLNVSNAAAVALYELLGRRAPAEAGET